MTMWKQKYPALRSWFLTLLFSKRMQESLEQWQRREIYKMSLEEIVV